MGRYTERMLRERIAALESEVAALRASRAGDPSRLMETIINATDNAVYAKDLQGRYRLVNDRYCEARGLARERIIGRTPVEIDPDEFAAQYIAHDREVIESGSVMNFRESAELPDGRHEYLAIKFPIVDGAGRVRGVGGISTDITDRPGSRRRCARARKSSGSPSTRIRCPSISTA